MLSISSSVRLRGSVATGVASWLARAGVSLTHDPAAAPAPRFRIAHRVRRGSPTAHRAGSQEPVGMNLKRCSLPPLLGLLFACAAAVPAGAVVGGEPVDAATVPW